MREPDSLLLGCVLPGDADLAGLPVIADWLEQEGRGRDAAFVRDLAVRPSLFVGDCLNTVMAGGANELNETLRLSPRDHAARMILRESHREVLHLVVFGCADRPGFMEVESILYGHVWTEQAAWQTLSDGVTGPVMRQALLAVAAWVACRRTLWQLAAEAVTA